ncbi:hypothetical protein [Amycolatopsis nalaikhensis]|uniref:Uncharacterized protein n=1 Tax=Amycolatopsis nalaikhensis TaxID=715472 RepID=A0ABY8X8W3_9PSEU|nr:hypothetical protein [Amycolatopsis sp. 2-2]WIV52828.1 hypothetical protein QP939_28200 [Amycolatopsis sp. 2-2]
MSDTYIPSRLDQALFAAPFIVINADNAAHTITHNLDDAVTILNTDGAARAIVGTLRQPLLAIDIDPEDTDAGEVVAEQLLLWADHYGLPCLRRDSGRPGHTHLVIKTPPCLREELRLVVRTVATRQNVSATVRSPLRLTSSPHRHGLPSPILSCTLTTADVPQDTESGPRPAARCPRRRGNSGASRSEGEYGHALALARAGHSTAHAWAFANMAGTKAREIGQKAWRRWFWAPATTIAAAERGLTEQQAWDLFRQASPTQAAHVGKDEWRRSRWLPALWEAEDCRPRRRRLGPRQATDRQCEPAPRRLRRVRAVLQAAVDRHLEGEFGTASRTGTIAGVRVASLRAALDAFAHAVLATRGSISIRHWAERAGLDPKTVRRARDAAIALGILKRVHRYAGGDSDCDAFAPVEHRKPRASSELTSPTLYTPVLGSADVSRLQWQHRLDRIQRSRMLSGSQQLSQKKPIPPDADTEPSSSPHQHQHALPAGYAELRERKWKPHRDRTKDLHRHNDRSAHALQHTHRGHEQQVGRNELLRHVRQRLTGSNDSSTLTASLMKRHESNVQIQLNEPTFNDLPCSAPEHAAEAQPTTGSPRGHPR